MSSATRAAVYENDCETLSLLLEGQSQKQVANSLNIGTRTVHDYVARLYEHFRDSSRAELLAYFVRRTPTPRRPVLETQFKFRCTGFVTELLRQE